MPDALRLLLDAAVLAEHEDEFWAQLGEHVHQFDLDTPAATEAHERCDRELVNKVDAVICPVLGPRGSANELWFENLDFYGDGVRQLSFRWSDFPSYLVIQLQSLLVRDHQSFCILCKFHTKRMEKGELVGLLALFHDTTLVTRPLFDAFRNKHV
jgi:hypothetical protein